VPDRSFDFRPLAFLAILALAGCEGSPSSPPAISPGSRGVNAAQEGNVEGEILGVVWVGDTLAGPDSRFRVQLQPDAATQAALSSIPGLDFSNSVFVQGDLTKVQWDYFVWGDPDGGNNGLCTGDPIKDVEVHMQFDASTGTLVPADSPTGRETHCVVPGRYTVTLLQNETDEVPGTAHEIDFITGVLNGPPSSATEVVEDSDAIFVDNVVHFDIAGSQGFTINAAAENPGDGPVDEPFEFRTTSASTTWSRDNRGQLSARWTWDAINNPNVQSGHMNTEVGDGGLRVVRVNEYDETQVGSVTARADFLIPTGQTDQATTSFEVQPSGPAPVATVSVIPSSATLTSQGETVQLSATLRDAAGNVLTDRPIDWSSSNPSVATVTDNDATAIVTAQSEGFATVTATSEGVSDQASITVDFPPEPTTVVVSPSSASIEVGEPRQFSALVFDGSGNRLFDAEQALSWTSSNPSVATMTDASGPVASALGQGGGTTTIRAQVEGVSDTASLQVTVPPPPVDDAEAVSNSLPTQIAAGQFIAASVRMKNTGTTTWSSSGDYDVKRVSPTGVGFIPTGVGLGSAVVDPQESETFPFNFSAEVSPGDYLVEYRMRHAFTLFGEANGRMVTVTSDGCTKNCELATTYDGGGPVPGGALDGGRAALSAPADTVLQRLEVVNYRLRRVTADGREAAIEYYGSLAEPWEVDVTFRLESDPGTVAPGVVRKSIQLTGYEVEVESDGPGVTLVHLKRAQEGAALPAGELLLLRIPLASPGAERLPERLTRVELIARQ